MTPAIAATLADAASAFAGEGVPVPEMQWEYELLTDDRKVLRWPGKDAEDAARRCADAKGVTIIATRPVRHGLFTLGRGGIID